jgi:hypothetical protein
VPHLTDLVIVGLPAAIAAAGGEETASEEGNCSDGDAAASHGSSVGRPGPILVK